MSAKGRVQVTGVVLAGGRSRRMRGINKARMQVDGQPLFRYAVNNLAGCCGRVVINTNRNQAAYQHEGFETIDDGAFDDKGPLAGVHAALKHATTPYVAIAACDQLALPDTIYPALCASATASRGAFACSPADTVPTCAVLPVGLLDEVRDALANGRLSLMAFMRDHADPVYFEGVEFGNVNSPHDTQDGSELK